MASLTNSLVQVSVCCSFGLVMIFLCSIEMAQLRLSVFGADGSIEMAHRWNGLSVLGADGPNQCFMKDMVRFEWLPENFQPKYCVRKYDDVVSNQLRQTGGWNDCFVLNDMWTDLPCPPDRPTCTKGLFLEIGANIGACLMMMLARKDVTHAIAFEPNPANLFYLTSSALANPSMNAKLSLYPVGLGKVSGKHVFYAEKNNAGNTVLDNPVRTGKKVAGEVQVIPLDSLFDFDAREMPYVHLVKIDAQGFEVFILQGAVKLLASGIVNAWKLELAGEWLKKQGASSAEFLNVFIEHGYQIYTETSWQGSHRRPLSNKTLRFTACKRRGFFDLLALRMPTGALERQHLVSCDRR